MAYRGLCRTHYELLRKEVQRGTLTWEEAEAAGRIAPVRHNPNWGWRGY